MGLRLGDIKELLDVRNRGTCPCGHTRVLVEQRLVDVQAEIDQLEQVRVSSSSLEEDVTPSAWTPTPWTGHVQ
jgi:DNA-binding transcriptional MerR regulator